jgi:hypothetical protein
VKRCDATLVSTTSSTRWPQNGQKMFSAASIVRNKFAQLRRKAIAFWTRRGTGRRISESTQTGMIRKARRTRRRRDRGIWLAGFELNSDNRRGI